MTNTSCFLILYTFPVIFPWQNNCLIRKNTFLVSACSNEWNCFKSKTGLFYHNLMTLYLQHSLQDFRLIIIKSINNINNNSFLSHRNAHLTVAWVYCSSILKLDTDVNLCSLSKTVTSVKITTPWFLYSIIWRNYSDCLSFIQINHCYSIFSYI